MLKWGFKCLIHTLSTKIYLSILKWLAVNMDEVERKINLVLIERYKLKYVSDVKMLRGIRWEISDH